MRRAGHRHSDDPRGAAEGLPGGRSRPCPSGCSATSAIPATPPGGTASLRPADARAARGRLRRHDDLPGSMLQSVGHPARIVVIGPDPLRPRLFTHIYPRSGAGAAGAPWTPPCRTRWAGRPRCSSRNHFAAKEASHEVRGGRRQARPDDGRRDRRHSRGDPRPGPPAARQPGQDHLGALRSRGLLRQDLWMRWLLRRMWATGLPPGVPAPHCGLPIRIPERGRPGRERRAPSRTASRRCQRADLAAVNGSLR